MLKHQIYFVIHSNCKTPPLLPNLVSVVDHLQPQTITYTLDFDIHILNSHLVVKKQCS